MLAAFLQSSYATCTSTSRRMHTLIAIPHKDCLPFPSGASELPVKGCTMQSWQSLGVHLWMTLSKLRHQWRRWMLICQRRQGMRLSWKRTNPGNRVLESWRHSYRWVFVIFDWGHLIRWNFQGSDLEYSHHNWCRLVSGHLYFIYFKNPARSCWYLLCKCFVYLLVFNIILYLFHINICRTRIKWHVSKPVWQRCHLYTSWWEAVE